MPCGRQDVLEALLDRVQRVVERRADHRGLVQRLADGEQRLLVAGPQPQAGQRVGDAADGRRVGAAVVVDHDDDRPVLGGGDVVQRLPGHAAGQRAVADDGDDGPRVTADGEGLGQPVGVGQRGGGVAVLDPVVLALGPARVARQAAALAEPVEALDPAGEHLVHVGLVAGVEDDRLARGVEHPVQRDGQLDAAEVGAEVATGPRHAGDQRVADLGGERGQLVGGQRPQVGGAGERSQERHGGAGSSLRRRHGSRGQVAAAHCSRERRGRHPGERAGRTAAVPTARRAVRRPPPRRRGRRRPAGRPRARRRRSPPPWRRAAAGRPARRARCASRRAPPPGPRPRGRRRSGRAAPGTAAAPRARGSPAARGRTATRPPCAPSRARPAGAPAPASPAAPSRPPPRACGVRTAASLEPELLEAPGPGAAGVVADQLPALGAESVEHRAGVTLLAFELSAGQLDADPGRSRSARRWR